MKKEATKAFENHEATKKIIIFFSLCAVISFAYSLFTNKYNGDFLGYDVNISVELLIFNLVLCLIPFILLWRRYKYFSRKKANKPINIKYKFIELIFFIFFIWKLFLIIKYDVGRSTMGVYQASGPIKILIQISNRISLEFIFTILFFSKIKSRRLLFYTILMIVWGLSRFSIGIFLTIALLLILKYFPQIKWFIKKRKALILVLIFVLPIIFSSLYSFRNSLRGVNQDTISKDLITGVLIGRLSSFSNSAQIFEKPLDFLISSQVLETFYFQKQAIGGILGGQYLPKDTPEALMLSSKSNEQIKNVSFMTGTQGNLILSFLKSPFVFILNFFSIIFFINLTFRMTRLLDLDRPNEISVILLIYPVMSGVANEYASFFLTPLIIYFYMVIVNGIYKK